MEPGRRAQYRVEIDEQSGARVTVQMSGGLMHEGQLLDVSAGGAGVRFDAVDTPRLAVGQQVDLVFGGRPFGAPLTVPARVQHRTEERDGARRYGFRFLQPQQVSANLAPELRSYFNRRQVIRVPPAPDETIAVELRAGDGPPIDVRLHDLSVLGAGVVLDTAVEPYIADSPTVLVSIHLPAHRRPVEMAGSIRYRRLVGECIHYGIAFDPLTTADWPRQQEAISRWVLKRQLQFLRTAG